MTKPKPPVVMALYPSYRGIGFCVFAGPDKLVDWGYSEFRINKTKRTLKKINTLINLYQPEQAVLEDTQVQSSTKRQRAKSQNTLITEYLIQHDIPVTHYAMHDVGLVFRATNKDSRAAELAQLIPELKDYLPPKRKLWDNEHRNMKVFDAVALAQTFYYRNN